MDNLVVQKILVKITDDVIVDPIEVSSIQEETTYTHDGSPSGNTYIDFQGSVLTLKNGRKIFVRGLTPNMILDKLGAKPNEPK